MRLNSVEMQLFQAACADHSNDAAQQLLNLFAAECADDILLLLPTMPLGLLRETASHLFRAVNYEHRKRTGRDLAGIDEHLAQPNRS